MNASSLFLPSEDTAIIIIYSFFSFLDLCQDGADQRDYLYFLAVAYYKLEEFSEAEQCINRVLHMEPNNSQAKDLKKLVSGKIQQGMYIQISATAAS